MAKNTIRRHFDAEYTDLNEVLHLGVVHHTPSQMLLDGMPYVASDSTDVQKTWRKFGWVPPTETGKFKNRFNGN